MIARLLAWIKAETALATAETWAPPAYHPCSSEDPRCAETLRRLAECRERMKRMKSGVLDGRPVTCSASTDVSATIRRAQALTIGPVRAVPRRAMARAAR